MTLARVQQVVRLSFSGFGDPICIGVKERRNGIVPFPTPLQQPCWVVPTVGDYPPLIAGSPQLCSSEDSGNPPTRGPAAAAAEAVTPLHTMMVCEGTSHLCPPCVGIVLGRGKMPATRSPAHATSIAVMDV